MTKFTTQHRQLAFQQKLPPAAIALWQWIVENKNDDCYELSEFNSWVAASRGRPYHRDTLKSAIQQLSDCKFITIVKKFSWKIIRAVVHPIHTLLPRRKNSNVPEEILNLLPSKPQSEGSEVLQQQLLEKIEVCQSAGLDYRVGQREWLISFSLKELIQALAYMIVYNEQKGTVVNPEGFVRRCLEQNWRLKPASLSYEDYSSFVGSYRSAIESLIC